MPRKAYTITDFVAEESARDPEFKAEFDQLRAREARGRMTLAPGTRVSWDHAGKRRTGSVTEWAGAPNEVCVEVVNGAFTVSHYLPRECLSVERLTRRGE